MNVLIIGSGGREHALAWKVKQSPRLSQLFVIPGNAGTNLFNYELRITDHQAITSFAHQHHIDLVLIGPEIPLADGLADSLRAAGLKVFGPSRAAAEIESSKAFAKAFMGRHNLPTARYQSFTDFESALEYVHTNQHPIVIKASGLAAGKGVILPNTLAEAEQAIRAIMLDHEFGSAGDEVILEEKLTGEEVSLLCFTDGRTLRAMPPAQDHKRLLDGDLGPNTGGMGAYAPAPICPPALVEKLTHTILQPAIDGLRSEDRPFIGVLYAGLMLTPDGPRLLEFNCRFGDPETQVVMPLLDSDLLEIAEACADGRLTDIEVRWKSGAAACVVLASEGYPGSYRSGREITGLDSKLDQAVAFHAGTKVVDEKVVTAGGRVLAVTGWGESIESALSHAYQAIDKIHFEGVQFRKDIGWRALSTDNKSDMPSDSIRLSPSRSNPLMTSVEDSSAYASSGVSIDSGNRAVALMRDSVRATYGPEVLAGIGAFGGLYSATALKSLNDPVLVASTDGVGTKVKLAAQARRYDSIGHDIVNHCINDILGQGARPLFFLDYIASSKLDPEMVAAVVKGIAAACHEAGCALLGGETAEMPGVYQPNEFDVAGTIVGVVDRVHILPRTDLKEGDLLIGLRSSGPHTNGYSLIRKIFADASLDHIFPELGAPLADALLAPHRSYLNLLNSPILQSSIKALAHLTGGGFIENIPRILPDHLDACIQLGTWSIPPLFTLIQQRGHIRQDEMYRVFNMGIGMIAIVNAENADAVQAAIPEETFVIGQLVAGSKQVILK
jgi:phosphoribosylamine--glycine ligase/phosphoribosylformylglycinamidine cyclo-ligase